MGRFEVGDLHLEASVVPPVGKLSAYCHAYRVLFQRLLLRGRVPTVDGSDYGVICTRRR